MQVFNKMLNVKKPNETMHNGEDTLVVLATYNSPMEAEVEKSKLESEGIWCDIRNEYMATFYPTGALPAQLVVRSSDLERAKRSLRLK